MKLRFSVDDNLRIAVKPFVKICSSVTQTELKLCHSFIIPDLDENIFFSDYYEAAELLNDFECEDATATFKKLMETASDKLCTVKCALARILAAKPHSANVERLISKNAKSAHSNNCIYFRYL